MNATSQGAAQDVKIMLQDAITAMQAASASAYETTGKVADQAHDPKLQDLLRQGAEHSQTWRERLSQAAQRIGAGQSAAGGNPVIDTIQQVGGKIIGKTADPTARDLGIIASGQLAMHYYVAAFGTMAQYAELLGEDEVARTIHDCLQEAKQGDERFTELAVEIGRSLAA